VVNAEQFADTTSFIAMRAGRRSNITSVCLQLPHASVHDVHMYRHTARNSAGRPRRTDVHVHHGPAVWIPYIHTMACQLLHPFTEACPQKAIPA
jgi:hypothetical protein